MNSTAAQQQVHAAQNELDVLLAKGLSTFEARKKLKEAQTELSLIEQKENQKLSATESRKKSARKMEAGEIIASVTDELDKTVESLLNIQIPTINVPLHFAENVLLAHEHLSAAQEKQREQESDVAELRQRQTELQEKRKDIITRRAAGNGDDEKDGPALALLQADMENLNDLIDKKINSTEAANTSQQERAVAEAQQALSTAINAAYIECKLSLALQLESSLVATAQSLVASPGIIPKKRYSPCPAIKEACQNGIF